MGRIFPEGITEFQDIDPGIYSTVIESAQERVHEEDGRLYYQCQFRVTEPQERAGSLRTEGFWIGTREDPSANDLQTWKNAFGASRLKGLCAKVGVPIDKQDMEVVLQSLINLPVMIEIERKLDKQNIMRTNVRQFHALGERQPFVKPQEYEQTLSVSPPAPMAPQGGQSRLAPAAAYTPPPAYIPPAVPPGQAYPPGGNGPAQYGAPQGNPYPPPPTGGR